MQTLWCAFEDNVYRVITRWKNWNPVKWIGTGFVHTIFVSYGKRFQVSNWKFHLIFKNSQTFIFIVITSNGRIVNCRKCGPRYYKTQLLDITLCSCSYLTGDYCLGSNCERLMAWRKNNETWKMSYYYNSKQVFNSLAPVKCGSCFINAIPEHMLGIKFMSTSQEIALMRMSSIRQHWFW